MKFTTLKILFLMCFTAASITGFCYFSKTSVSGKTTMWDSGEGAVWDGSSDTDWYSNDISVYEISSARQLAGLAVLVNGGNDFSGKTVKLKGDIVLNNTSSFANWKTMPPINNWVPIGKLDFAFNGTFDGKGFLIRGLYSSNKSENGLFGWISNLGAVCNVEVFEGFIINSGGNGGGITARNYGTIYNCGFNGVIQGINSGGGIAAINNVGGKIVNCYNKGKIDAVYYNGGICGYNHSLIENCCNLGILPPSTTKKGGIVSNNKGEIKYCYWYYNSLDNTSCDKGINNNQNIFNTALNINFQTVNSTIKVNNIVYSSLTEALNYGAALFSANNMQLNNWETENGTVIFAKKELSVDLTVLSSEQIEVKVSNTDSDIQLWVKESISLHGNGYLWSIKQDYSKTSSVIIENNFKNEDLLCILIRLKDSKNKVTNVYKKFSADESFSRIKDIAANSQTYSLTDTIYLPLTNASLDFSFSVTPETLTASTGTFNGNVLNITSFEKIGVQTLTVICNGIAENIKIKVYDNIKNYAYIENVEITKTGNTVTLIPNIKTMGEGGEYSIAYYMNNRTNTSGTFTLKDSGFNFYNIKILSLGRETDTFSGYYKYGQPEKSINTALELYTNVNESVKVGQAAASEGKEYQLIKWDIRGEYLIKNWSAVSFLNFTPTKNGIYLFQYRVRTTSSQCNFEEEVFINVTVGDVIENTASLLIPDTVRAREINEITVDNINAASDVMYKFIIRANGLYDVAEYYSPSNILLWAPNKKGNYTIEVRIISGESYGYADTVINTSVLVI